MAFNFGCSQLGKIRFSSPISRTRNTRSNEVKILNLKYFFKPADTDCKVTGYHIIKTRFFQATPITSKRQGTRLARSDPRPQAEQNAPPWVPDQAGGAIFLWRSAYESRNSDQAQLSL